MDYKIVVVFTFKEPGGKDFAMTSEVIGFSTIQQAEKAYKRLLDFHQNAIYASVSRLY